jgi:hypothetical protein
MVLRLECRAAWAADTRNINAAVRVNEKKEIIKKPGPEKYSGPGH